jgi:flagellin
MAVINTNVKALHTQYALKNSARAQTVAMEQLSTGKRINSARDDAAGMAIAKRMSQQIRSLDMAIRNAGDAVALIQTAEGATGTITDMLQRMRELAIQSLNDTNAQDQRGYLDLEFQQLKQQIVTISEHTQWNGFSILNGTAGEPVGERPVYKKMSVGQFDQIFISPTTTRSIAGAGAGEQQTLTFTGPATTGGTFTVGGISVTVPPNADVTAIAAATVTALTATDAFGPNSGRTITSNAGVVTITYPVTEGDVSDTLLAVKPESTGIPAVTPAVPVKAVVDTQETFLNGGKFLDSGTLQISMPPDASTNVTAQFTDSLGVETTLTGTVNRTTGVITFVANEGNNSKLISNTLIYTLQSPSATPGTLEASNLANRAVNLTVDVSGSVPALKTGDLVFVKRNAAGEVIDRITIPESDARDDKLSPPNNAAGSAIAIAAAINKKSEETGVVAVVNTNVMVGSPMTGETVVSGNLVINGFSTPRIETLFNNPRDSRAAIVEAINFISEQTGVVAINTGSDAEGIRLEAKDGRNIEVGYANLSTSATEFAARVGVRAGIQAGTYSLEARVETPIEIESNPGNDINRARLAAGTYTENVSTLVTVGRAPVTSSTNIKPLGEGDLMINGVRILGTTNLDDRVSNIQTLTSNRSASALAIATAINSQAALTGVTATALGASTQGDTTSRTLNSGVQSLYINGIEVKVDFGVGSTEAERINEVLKQVNLKTGEHGVQATKTANGALNLSTVDGRNLSVWYDQKMSADPTPVPTVTAADFGLSGASGVTAMSPDATDNVTAANFKDAETVYGRLQLSSPTSFEIKPGINGLNGNFFALGFQQGVFGGEVNLATSKMTPPNVGRLTFHVGAAATQTVHIDFADYGAKGPITGSITGDVHLWNSDLRVNRIDNSESARAMLEKLDTALDKVNGNRAVMGAVMNRLDYIMENLANVSMNTSASRSQIEDADYAKASTELARTGIMQQAATAILAQANMDQQTVLKLLG